MIYCPLSFKEVTNSKLLNQTPVQYRYIAHNHPTKFRQMSSELFKDRGTNGDMPCPIGKSRVFTLALESNSAECFAAKILRALSIPLQLSSCLLPLCW